MRNKSLFLLLAGICGTIAAVGVGQWMQAQNGNAQIQMVEILVTTQAVNAEEQITPDKLRLEQWPVDRVPTGASSDLTQFEGRFAKVPLYEGEPMLDVKLMNEVEDKVVPQGYSVVSLEAGRDGTVNLVSPGDRVDIRGFFTKGEFFPRDTALDVLTGVKVYGIDGITKFDEETPRPRNARNIQLLIRRADVDAFDFAKKLGEISLSLGSPSADEGKLAEGEMSVSAKTFLQDLQERRDEQERLRKLAEQEQQNQGTSEPVQTKSNGKKVIHRMVKLEAGRLVEYEWLEGETLPRISGELNPTNDSAGDATPSTDSQDTQTTSGGDDFLRGANSPFFAPPTGEGGE
ncbi:Flp pilus assembly protein CpaB [Rhodopirellula sp. MGV]|uniref:Flp pilus assembly protein CpaB n=1 Tax=Rhodopirellula sp. MGV TaxID=2023130 RepID=UPI000B965C4F|nr:Flp pilus assembly protein CpaB [Rhodopirellula sp. MGV]OYP37516.1 Flp pilus assembly protein CpaB [Rhodopirellula sp. MGV]PNY37920.1 Flp pilus assembly protein CpaB [Rhodopirellula baltica]